MPLTDADVTKMYWGTKFRGDANFAQVIDAIQDTVDANSAKLAELTAAITGLVEALRQAASAPGQALDLAAVQEAARKGAAEAIAGIDVTVHTTTP